MYALARQAQITNYKLLLDSPNVQLYLCSKLVSKGGVSMSSILRLSFAMLLTSALVWAQFGSGIQGTVVDRTSAVVPGVLIRVTNLDTGVSREVVSSEEGVYRVTSLSTGTYKMRAMKEGFISAEQDSLVLQVAEIRKVDFTLEVGNVLENVTVTGRPTILETEEGRISGTLSSADLRDM